MPTAEIIEPQSFAELMQSMPVVWTALLAIGLVVGLVLWTFGGRLAQKGVMLTGFVVGGLGAAALAMGMNGGATPEAVQGAATTAEQAVNISGGGGGLWVLAIGIGGALAGGLLAWLLFRFWMAGTCAVLLAAVVPLSALIYAGNGPTLSAVQSTQDVTLDALGAGESDPAAEALRLWQQRSGGGGPPPRGADADETAGNDGARGVSELFDREQFFADLQGVWQQQVEEVKLWWAELTPGSRRFLWGGAVVGAGLGLVVGLVLPTLAAGLQSAMVGSVLILLCGQTLLLKYFPAMEGVVPHSRRGVLLSLGLITLLGVLIQWSLRKKKADE